MLPGLARAAAIRPVTEVIPKPGLTTAIFGTLAMSMTGVRSRIGSKGIEGSSAGSVAMGPGVPITREVPSGAEAATCAVPVTPPAPGRDSTMTGWPNSPCP